MGRATKSDEPGLQDYLDRIHHAENFDDIWALLNQFRAHKGFTSLTYMHIPPLGALDQEKPLIASEGFAQDWVAHFIENDYISISPVMEYARTAITPFCWSEIMNEDLRDTTTSPEIRKYVTNYLAYNVGDGLAFPLYGPMGRRALCSVGLPEIKMAIPAVLRQELQIIFQGAHLRYCDIILQSQSKQADLSPREVEILSWVARGKSNSVIANILEVSTHTIDTHMRRIYAKLNVTDRVAAAIYGVGAGILK
ncbi:LuxR family transcriptional regulator [Asticcacaulis sp. ZE23SCel15]|uniref:helix-turn-helix transcriptional regulator n=1 Tax=Asticcacaulis sp. ZE23SCel15 TaxID=3059027 RepID=UPI00265F80E8|nr:LuxR family transcriptional regulator [Asticcacaulis sp. ZE23SCel15]WKL58819.1 LuxR family transcriptional regulator [Asticcacaulis sp. ZE23SCel15]